MLKIDTQRSDPWTTLEIEPGVVELYFRSPEREEIHSIWIDAADRAGLDVADLERVRSALGERWSSEALEHDGAVIVVGRSQLAAQMVELRGEEKVRRFMEHVRILRDRGKLFEGELEELLGGTRGGD